MTSINKNGNPIRICDGNYVMILDDIGEIKTVVLNKIADTIKKNGWNQKHAAKILGIDQPKISHIKNGRSAGFSLERLLKFLSLVGYRISVSLTGTDFVSSSPGIYDANDLKNQTTRSGVES